jgi:hypothetical protein
MTPQERQLIDDLFDRLSKLENTPRDPAVRDRAGPAQAPNASMRWCRRAVQDEALKRANDRIQQLKRGRGRTDQSAVPRFDARHDLRQSQPRGSGA